MEIQQIGRHNLLIYVSGDELHTPPQEIETDDAATILKTALGGACRDEWKNVYLELYIGQDCLLMFARAHSGVPRFFAFDGIEQLISAAGCCPPDVISFLVLLEGEYLLVIYPWPPDMPPGALTEYGRELDPGRNNAHSYALHLTEHGKVLLGPSAIFDLQSIF